MNLRRIVEKLNRFKLEIDSLRSQIVKGSSFVLNSLTQTDQQIGDILYAGTGSHAEVSASHLVYLDSTKQWRRASGGIGGHAGDDEIIGIALSPTPQTQGVLVRGIYKLNTSYVSSSSGDGTFNVGVQVYTHHIRSGSFTTTQPTGSGEIARVLGHSIDSDVIFFNPSQDYIEV